MSRTKHGSRLIVLRGQVVAGPFGDREAEVILRSIERRYRKVGLRPPPLATTVLHPGAWLDSWVAEDIYRQCAKDAAPTEETGS
jgi:hypothetical protein